MIEEQNIWWEETSLHLFTGCLNWVLYRNDFNDEKSDMFVHFSAQ